MENADLSTPETDLVVTPDSQSNKNAKIMAALYAVAVFVFCFLGLIVIGVAGYGRERDGVLAAKILAGPATFALVGLASSVAAMFFLKGKDLYQILVPVFLSMVFGIFGWITIFIFFGVIWRML